MRTSALLFTFVAALAGLGAGCGEKPVPLYVDYDAEVAPLLHARCVRCHGAGGTLNGDSDVTGLYKAFKGKPIQGYFDCENDRGDCSDTGTTCKRGLRYYSKDMPGEAAAAMILKDMPPPPAPPLTDRESEILHAWLAYPTASRKQCP